MVTRVAALSPHEERLTPRQWAQRHLFAGVWNTILTLATAVALGMALVRVVRWVTLAHWGVIADNLRFWVVGLMPIELVARALWAGGLIAGMALLTAVGVRARVRRRTLLAAWGSTIVAVLWIMSPLRLDQIGGLYLTLLLAVVAIALSFPLGVLVGIGRVSTLPVIRAFSIAYIEVIRGVPFIAVLLWFFIFVSLVSGDTLSRVERAMIAMTIFTSAYVGEIVRAGIQSVPRGLVEAARAVGLSSGQTMRFIVLPQAIKNMIPALVGQFISLFKDTSLGVIIGLSELVGTGRQLLSITRYLHDVREVYVFLIVVYFVFTYAMSYGSRVLEQKLGLGER